LVTFLETVMKNPNKGDIPLGRLSMHQQLIAWELYTAWVTGGRIHIRAPWGSGKTLILEGFILWVIGQDVNSRFLLVCAAGDEAKDRLKVIRQYIYDDDKKMGDPDYLHVFPHVKPRYGEWHKEKITVRRDVKATDPTVAAYGVDKTGTGYRGHLILDDPTDIDDLISKAKRESRKQKVRASWISRIDEGCMGAAIDTPWHEDDAMSNLEKPTKHFDLLLAGWRTLYMAVSEELNSLKLRAVNYDEAEFSATVRRICGHEVFGGDGASETDGMITLPLPRWYNGRPGMLMKLAELGTIEFQRGMQMRSIDRSLSPFKQEWIIQRSYDEFRHLTCTLYAMFDPAWGRRKAKVAANNYATNACYTAILLLLRTPNGKILVVEDIQTHESPAECYKLACDAWQRWSRKPNIEEGRFGFETNFDQGYLFDGLTDYMEERNIMIPFQEYSQKSNKEARLESTLPFFERGDIMFTEEINRVIQQILDFPEGLRDGFDAFEAALNMARNPVFESEEFWIE
jgi:predicted phage terminase large subunit-like protein